MAQAFKACLTDRSAPPARISKAACTADLCLAADMLPGMLAAQMLFLSFAPQKRVGPFIWPQLGALLGSRMRLRHCRPFLHSLDDTIPFAEGWPAVPAAATQDLKLALHRALYHLRIPAKAGGTICLPSSGLNAASTPPLRRKHGEQYQWQVLLLVAKFAGCGVM